MTNVALRTNVNIYGKKHRNFKGITKINAFKRIWTNNAEKKLGKV